MNEKMPKSEFWRQCTPAKIKGQITTGAVCAYLSAAVTTIMAIALMPLAVVDAVLTLGLGLGLHLARSRVCGIILSAYFILSKIQMVLSGTTKNIGAVGIVIAVAFVMATISTFQYQKLWKEYINGEFIPETQDNRKLMEQNDIK